MQNMENTLKEKFAEYRQEILSGDSQQRKFRRRKDFPSDDRLYYQTLNKMIDEGVPETDVIAGIKNKIFDAKDPHFGDDVSLVIRYARADKDFIVAKDILCDACVNLNKGNKDKTIAEINKAQNMLYDLSEIREHNPQLTKKTEEVYKAFGDLMQAYSVSPIFDASKHSVLTDEYFYGKDDYRQQIELEKFRNQVDSTWDFQDRLEKAKKRVYEKMTQKEVSEYEQYHAQQVKQEDLQDKINRNRVLEEHEDYVRSREHCSQINEDRLYRTEDRVVKAYEDFKDVARKTDDTSDQTKKKDDKLSAVPERATFIGRITPNGKIKE